MPNIEAVDSGERQRSKTGDFLRDYVQTAPAIKTKSKVLSHLEHFLSLVEEEEDTRARSELKLKMIDLIQVTKKELAGQQHERTPPARAGPGLENCRLDTWLQHQEIGS